MMEQRKHKAESAIELIQNRITELVTASNGNKIFLLAAGYMIGANLDLAESYGYYWTTSIGTTNSRYGLCYYFLATNWHTNNQFRPYGCSIRAVTE